MDDLLKEVHSQDAKMIRETNSNKYKDAHLKKPSLLN